MKNSRYLPVFLISLNFIFGCSSNPKTEKLHTNSIGVEFIRIPEGEFKMGTIKEGQNSNEFPQHKVKITRSFYMSTYPVTVGQFKEFIKATGYKTEGEKAGGSWVWTESVKWEQKSDASWKNPYFPQTDNHPVVCVSWNDAQAFIEWLNSEENEIYRLPTEAEFEYALRAGTTTPYFFGSDTTEYTKYGWAQTLTEQGFPSHPVGEKSPNPWGLYDMVGNAWQWCDDWYDENYYANSPEVDPICTAGKWKVNRGGMGSNIMNWRSTVRDALPPNEDYSNQSFRLVLEIK